MSRPRRPALWRISASNPWQLVRGERRSVKHSDLLCHGARGCRTPHFAVTALEELLGRGRKLLSQRVKVSLTLSNAGGLVEHGCHTDTHKGVHAPWAAAAFCAGCMPHASASHLAQCRDSVLAFLRDTLAWHTPLPSAAQWQNLPKAHRSAWLLPTAVIVRENASFPHTPFFMKTPPEDGWLALSNDDPSQTAPLRTVLHGIIHFNSTDPSRQELVQASLREACGGGPAHVHVVVFTASVQPWLASALHDIGPGNASCALTARVLPASAGHMFPWLAQRALHGLADAGEVGLVSLWEDDFLVKRRHWRAVHSLLQAEGWPQDWLPGLQQYEYDPSAGQGGAGSTRHLLNAELSHNEGYVVYTWRRVDWAVPMNVHTGGYIVTPRHLAVAAASGCLLRAAPTWSQPLMDAATSAVYQRCGFMKVTPLQAGERFLVHHASQNKVHDKAFIRRPENSMTWAQFFTRLTAFRVSTGT